MKNALTLTPLSVSLILYNKVIIEHFRQVWYVDTVYRLATGKHCYMSDLLTYSPGVKKGM